MKISTKKSKMRKSILIGATAFSSLALLTTGLASWVIYQDSTAAIDNSITVSGVEDTNLSITATFEVGGAEGAAENTFVFDAANEDNAGRFRWDGKNSEHLTGTLTITVTTSDGYKVKDVLGGLSFKISANDGAESPADKNGVVNSLIKSNHIALSGVESLGTETTIVTGTLEEDNEQTFVSENIGFKWGTAFGGENPSLYYDGTGTGKNIATDIAKTEIEKLKVLNNIHFHIEVAAKTKTTE